jgi:hypothetical protein
MWFIGFCFMTDQWRQEPSKDIAGWNGRNSVQAAIAFSFFSILVWVRTNIGSNQYVWFLFTRERWEFLHSFVSAGVFLICSARIVEIIQLLIRKHTVPIHLARV